MPIIEADNQLHLHRDIAAHTFDDADHVWVLAAGRHEIDQTNGAALCFNFSFENECFSTVASTRRYNLFLRKKPPVPIFCVAEQRRETRRRIKSRKAEPIDAAVAAHQCARLCIAQKCVVLDLCVFLRHLTLPLPLPLKLIRIPTSFSCSSCYLLFELLFPRQFRYLIPR